MTQSNKVYHSVQQLINTGHLIRHRDGIHYPKTGCTLVLEDSCENPIQIKSLDVIHFPIKHLNVTDTYDNQYIGGDPTEENIKIA